MIVWCTLQYIVVFSNLAIVSAFCALSLCCRARENQFGNKIKVLILMPFFTTFFTAAIAFYYLMNHDFSSCIIFGSWVAMFAIDLENQMIFIIGVYFINTT